MKQASTLRSKLLRRRISYTKWILIWLSLFIGLSLLGIWSFAVLLWFNPSFLHFLGLLLFITTLLLFGYIFINSLIECWTASGRIVPYYEKRVYLQNLGGTFRCWTKYGYEMVKQCKRLDALAKEIGCKPISTFGFNDDWDWQKLIWHDPSEGIATFSSLIKKCESLACMETLVKEMQWILHDLELAQSKNIRFCLIVRISEDTRISSLEMDRRKGYFW